MKQLIFASSIALLAIGGNAWLNQGYGNFRSASSYYDSPLNDTTPGKKDTSKHKPRKDSLHKKDTTHHY